MNPVTGITLNLAAIVVFVTMQSLIKAASGHVPAGEVVFIRSLFALPVIVLWLAWTRELGAGLRVVNRAGHFWRGLVGTAAMMLAFAALALLPLPEFMALGYATPLLTVVFAALFLGEKVSLARIVCVGLGMVGVLIVLSPRLAGIGNAGEALGAGLMLASAALAAVASVTVRALVATETTSAIVFWFSVLAALLALPTLLFGWVVPTGREALLLILSGLCGGLGQVLLTASYRHADASVLAPFSYASMLLALVIGYFAFGEVPTFPMLAGAALIVTAGLVIVWCERRPRP